MDFAKLHLRSESKQGELRTPLLPRHARQLIQSGIPVLVERSPNRIFSDEEYSAEGCELVKEQSWVSAAPGTLVLGLKELPSADSPLTQAHCYFAHCYKSQAGAEQLLSRFKAGGGTLLDLEFLTDAQGKRVAAFGYWAGFMGAALGLIAWHYQSINYCLNSAQPWESAEALKAHLRTLNLPRSALVTGFRGRSGQGAMDLLGSVGVLAEGWDLEETAGGGPFAVWADSPLLIHCVASRKPGPPFLTEKEIDLPGRKLSVLVDVTCDTSGPLHLFPFFRELSSLENPATRIRSNGLPLDIVAIDHLPTLLPRESSVEFAGLLFPHLRALLRPENALLPWRSAEKQFHRHTQFKVREAL